MWLNNGVWVKGPPPQAKSNGPRVVRHRSQRTVVASSGNRLDNMMSGKARICVYRSLGGLGDIIMATPISRGAKKKYRDCHVTYAVPIEYAGGDLVALLEHNPFIDEVVDYKLVNRDSFDSLTDITRIGLQDERPRTIPPNRIDLFANACGIPLFNNYQPVYVMTEEERKWGEEFVERATRGKKYKGLISIHLGSRDPKRSWPHHRIREFVGICRKQGYFCFLYEWGAIPDNWRLAGSERVFDFRLRDAAAVMYATDILVCPDSSLLHLAGALNFKTVSLFGSMPPACRINHYPNAVAVVNQQIGCLGCVYAPCVKNYYCMSSILPEAVLAAVRQRIDSDLIHPQKENQEEMVKPGVFVPRSISTFAI